MIADFNIHLPPDGDFNSETNFDRFDVTSSWEAVRARFPSVGIDWCNVMLLDPRLMKSRHVSVLRDIRSQGHGATVGIDPRMADALELVDLAAREGASGIKFHPYFLGLEDADFGKAVLAAKRAAKHGLWVCVCCSYGTKNVYKISGIRLLLALLEANIDTRIIALHSGGRHVLDVMLAAFDAPNVMLELSFSIPFWIGSSVEQDFLFAIRKLGADRFLYASDHPHMDMQENAETVRAWLAGNGFKDDQIAKIFYENAKQHFIA